MLESMSRSSFIRQIWNVFQIRFSIIPSHKNWFLNHSFYSNILSRSFPPLYKRSSRMSLLQGRTLRCNDRHGKSRSLLVSHEEIMRYSCTIRRTVFPICLLASFERIISYWKDREKFELCFINSSIVCWI